MKLRDLKLPIRKKSALRSYHFSLGGRLCNYNAGPGCQPEIEEFDFARDEGLFVVVLTVRFVKPKTTTAAEVEIPELR